MQSGWERTTAQLRAHNFDVYPDTPEPAVASPQELLQLREKIKLDLAFCDALLLLRSDDDSEARTDLLSIGRRARHEAMDLSGKPLPCALLDHTDRVLPLAKQFAISTLTTQASNWVFGVQRWLAQASQTNGVLGS